MQANNKSLRLNYLTKQTLDLIYTSRLSFSGSATWKNPAKTHPRNLFENVLKNRLVS